MTAPSRFYSKRSKRPLNAEQALAEIVTQPDTDAGDTVTAVLGRLIDTLAGSGQLPIDAALAIMGDSKIEKK